MKDRTIEILSPAGSADSFRAALRAGADAVYAGGSRFGARAYADNFSEEELIEAIREAHFYGRRLYLTVNTLLKETEIRGLYDYLAPYYENGLDAVIVQDLGAVEYIRTYFPGLDIHASTQMTITDAAGARFVRSQGMTRVVPARELSLEEIHKIREQTDLEIECFVHGALCYCYSGQCLLSSMIGGRSGNRGQCAQPCRLPYTFGEEKKYFLSPKDICTLELIPDLIEAGIDSFKIEGRMKRPEYVAGVTALYRKYTDLYLQKGRSGFRVLPEDREILMDLYNRGGSSSGYYKKRNGKSMLSLDRPNHAGVPAVKVQYQKGREVHGAVLTDLNPGDVLEIAGGRSNYTLGYGAEKGAEISFLVQKQIRLERGTVLSRTRNESLLRHINSNIIGKKLQRPAAGELKLKIGSRAVLSVVSGNISCEAVSEETVQPARNSPMDKEHIIARIKKTGNSDFCFETLSVDMDDNVFIPVQQLNALRRTALEKLKRKIEGQFMRAAGSAPGPDADRTGRGSSDKVGSAVSVESEEQLRTVVSLVRDGLSVDRIYLDTCILKPDSDEPDLGRLHGMVREFREQHTEVFIALPHIFRSTEEHLMERIMERAGLLRADGVLVRSCGQFWFLRERQFDKSVILDHNLYVFNRYAKRFWNKNGVTEFTAPLELTRDELELTGVDDCELEIYGAAPVMVSAQCLFKTSGRCRKDSGISVLTDRYGNHFPVRAFCSSCYNVIYNDRPLCLAKYMDEIMGMRPLRLRLRFTTESPAEVRRILERLPGGSADGRADGRDTFPEIPGGFSEGHFKKGIL